MLRSNLISVVHVVTGAAFGSEGKGHVTAQVVEKELITSGRAVLNVRVAGPNAGHTVIDQAGEAFALRQVPVGAAVDDSVWCYIAPGSEIDLPVLVAELELLRSKGHPVTNLMVSAEATLLTDEHKAQEAAANLNARVGSTAKGIGAARVDRLMRTAKRVVDDDNTLGVLNELGASVVDAPGSSPYITAWAERRDAAIVIEGTQGYGLGLHAGFYPQVTSSDARAIDFLAMAGLSPWHKGITFLTVWLVARVFPIRVAGNSGPLKGETTWDELHLPEEHTTVTKKVRRVGAWDADLVARAVQANGGGVRTTETAVVIALTMVDQMFPSISQSRSASKWAAEAPNEEREGLMKFLKQIERDTGATIGAMTTSPDTIIWRG